MGIQNFLAPKMTFVWGPQKLWLSVRVWREILPRPHCTRLGDCPIWAKQILTKIFDKNKMWKGEDGWAQPGSGEPGKLFFVKENLKEI